MASTSLLDSDNLLAGLESDSGQQQIQEIFNDSLAQTKLLSALILFCITLLCGYLPVRILFNQNYIQYAMFFGGGVLMATAFCHLIPETHDNYKLVTLNGSHELMHNHNHNHNHISHLDEQASDLAPQSLLAPNQTNSLNATKLLLAFNPSQPSEENLTLLAAHSGLLGQQATEEEAAKPGLNLPILEIVLCSGFFFMYLVEQLMVRFVNNHSHGHAACDESMGQLVGEPASPSDSQSNIHVNPTGSSSTDFIITSSTANLPATVVLGASNNNPAATGPTHQAHSGAKAARSTRNEFYKFMRGLLIVSAFGAHSIFDGVAIGSQETSNKVWTIFLAISCHKLIIAAVIGLELFTATLESHLWTLIHLSIFSIMSPIGILLVVVAQGTMHLNSNDPTMILLQSFATGTLLYIVFVEILQPKEEDQRKLKSDRNKFGECFSLIAGFALMVVVLSVIGDGD